MPNPLYTYVLNIYDLVVFGFMAYQTLLVTWCQILNNTYVLNIWFGFVWFYGISNIVGYLMPNPLYTYVLNIWFVNTFSW